MKSTDPKKAFSLSYFSEGPYKGAKISGMGRFWGKYYWARRFYAEIIRRITPTKGKILEIGCGFGDLLIFLEEQFQTFGTDVSQEAIESAKKKLHHTNLFVLSAEKTHLLPVRPFDTIVACHVLEHLKDPDKVLGIIAKSIKPGGSLFVVMPDPEGFGHRLKANKWVGFRDKTHISLYPGSRWVKLIEKHGFQVEKVFSDGFWDSPYIGYVPTIVQRIVFSIPSIIQIVLGYPMIRVRYGESIGIIAKKE